MTDVLPVTDTALVTLWCRASEARRADTVVDEPMRIRLVDWLDYDWPTIATLTLLEFEN